jgi:hypothetical protein
MTIKHPNRVSGATPYRPYRAFLLRCWIEAGDVKPVWRFTLVCLGEERVKRGFASLEALLDYLHDALRCSDEVGGCE